MDKTFPEWLQETQSRRDFLDEYGRTGANEGMDVDKAMSYLHEAQKLRSQAENYLTGEKKLAMFRARKEYGELTSRERDLIERDSVKDIQMVVNDLETTVSSCIRRYFTYGKS